MNSFEKGHLWMDGSGKVSVPVRVETKNGTVHFKMTVLPDDQTDKIRQWISLVTKETAEIDDGFCDAVLKTAESARQDPGQQRMLREAIQKAQDGAKRSRKALDQRILGKKQEVFKAAVRDLMDRGVSRKELAQLLKDAVIEGVYKS